MIHRKADVAVIGAGSAGIRAFKAARRWTDDVILIEGGPYGTTCARVGCMPSKLLIAAAESAHAATLAPTFGVNVGQIDIDGAAVMDRVRRERDRFVGFVVDGIHEIPEEHRIRGFAKFVSTYELQIDDHTLVTAKRVVIATGSTQICPPLFRGLGDKVIVNDDVFDWSALPRSVAVFGPGVVGLEIGQALSRLGVEVHMFGLGGVVGPLTDPKILATAKELFSQEFFLDAYGSVREVTRTGDGARITLESTEGTEKQINVDYVIAATGRRPNVDELGLENTSLTLDDRGVPVFDPMTMRIGNARVFIAGDVTNDRPVLHEAVDEGVIAGGNAGRYPLVHATRRSSALSVVFSDPQIAMIGDRYADLLGEEFVVGEASFDDQGRSRVMLQNRGLMRIYAGRETGRLLGAEMIAPRAEHLGHLLAWAHQSKMTISQLLNMPFYHPVVEEGLRTALRDAASKLQGGIRKVA